MNDLHGYYLEDLKVGMSASYAKTVTAADVIGFAALTGDDNPVHINEDYAAGTRFKGRIVHGMLLAGLISCVTGTRLPGPGAVYIGQAMKFRAAVRIGDTVTATATVKKINVGRRLVLMDTVCSVDGNVVIDGEATFMVDSRS